MGNISCFYSERQDPNSELPTIPINKKIKMDTIGNTNTDDDKRRSDAVNISTVINNSATGNEVNYNVKYKRRNDSESSFSRNLNMNVNK